MPPGEIQAQTGSLLDLSPDAYVVENLLCDRWLVQDTVVPPTINIVTNEPAHGGTRDHIARKVFAGAHSSHHNDSGKSVSQNRNDSRVRILMGDHRCQRPGADRVPRRKPGIEPAAGTVLKPTLTLLSNGRARSATSFIASTNTLLSIKVSKAIKPVSRRRSWCVPVPKK